MKKRITALLLVLAVVFAATACKSGNNGTTADKDQVNTADTGKKKDPIINVPGSGDDEPTSAPVSDPVPDDDPAEPSIAAAVPADWNPDITFRTTDFDMFEWDDTCFANAKLTMINLWAYWCGPCVGELPEIEKLSNDYADKGLQVFGITYPDEEADNRDMANEKGITYQNLFYTSDFDEYLDSGYLPTTIFVDSNGHVLGEPEIGARSYEDWAEIIDKYLGK